MEKADYRGDTAPNNTYEDWVELPLVEDEGDSEPRLNANQHNIQLTDAERHGDWKGIQTERQRDRETESQRDRATEG